MKDKQIVKWLTKKLMKLLLLYVRRISFNTDLIYLWNSQERTSIHIPQIYLTSTYYILLLLVHQLV